MKFKYQNWRGVHGPYTAEDAVEFEVKPHAGEDAIRALCGIVGRLIEVLPPGKAAEVIGIGWSVDDEQS